MKLLIFAGGAGTRLWPLSRKNSPKQFEKLKDDTSTLQMAIDRVKSFGMENIYVSTNETYVPIVRDQVPDLFVDNIFTEPAKRDLAAAVGLSLCRLKNTGYSGPIALLWADHFMDHPDAFVQALQKAQELITQKSDQFVFLAEKPRFANQNLGWINVGSCVDPDVCQFEGWKYRPELIDCQNMFESGDWYWNPGYFVTDLDFVLGLYDVHMPDMCANLMAMSDDEQKMKETYHTLEAVSFDNAIVEKIRKDQAVVLKVDLGWSDPGTLYALKEALVSAQEKNLIKGESVNLDSKDCFIFNEQEGKLVTTIGLEGMMVINTQDALLVCHKDDVPRIKELLIAMEQDKKDYL
ncbi:mannose-1-phosphate guanylyltransferase [Candidatus Nomurabacteria bacterium]|nr:mannose-1-phosphate guanylyltransferase [Candidatus Nomurabacteria bacterium]